MSDSGTPATPTLSPSSHDCPKVSQDEIDKTSVSVREAGVDLEGNGELGGWTGGVVVLVPTDRAIKDWIPLARRKL